MSTGERIRKLRKAKYMRQSDLAELLGNDGNTISRWERGVIGIGSAYIMKLAQVFDTTADNSHTTRTANRTLSSRAESRHSDVYL